MADIWIGTGYAGRDAEQKYLPNGTAVATFSMALDRGYGDKKTTVWVRVTCWNKLAEIVGQYVNKGKLVYVTGELQEPRPYQSNSGEWKASLDITAREVKFLGGKGESTGQGEAVASETEEQIPW